MGIATASPADVADPLYADVGQTLLLRARQLERALGLRELWLKFEGDSPTGTQKDRIALAQAVDAEARGYAGITVATCGNYGVALSRGPVRRDRLPHRRPAGLPHPSGASTRRC